MTKTKKNKIYEAIGYLNISKQIFVDGKAIDIYFSRGMKNPLRFGKYSTDDIKIQEALESCPEFNKEYKLIQIGKKVLNKEEMSKPINEQIVDLKLIIEDLKEENASLKNKIKTLEVKKKSEKEIVYVKDVFNGQQAKDYLVKNFDLDPDKLKNKMLIIMAARRKNINFPNWKQL